jgi:hypothetical protein
MYGRTREQNSISFWRMTIGDRRGDHHEEIPAPDLCTHSQPESQEGPGPLRGLLHVRPTLCHHFNRRFEFGGVSSGLMAGPDVLPVITRKRGNPNWGRPMPFAPALATAFEIGQGITPNSGTVRRLGGA